MRKSALFGFGLVVMSLVTLGLIILSSASEANGVRLHGDAYFFMKRQFVYLVGGIILATCVALFDYHRWRNQWLLTVFFYIVVVVLLAAVFGFRAINGSHRWISLGPVRLQPSELAKLAVVIATATWLDRAGWRVELWRNGFFVPIFIIGVLAGLVLIEPDFGSMMVVGCSGLLMMWLAGVRFAQIFVMFCGGFGVFIVKLLANRNRMARLMAFFGSDASADGAMAALDPAAKSAAYQAKMALVAIKNGGIWGVGLNESMQKQYYLPEAHTDFIFAIGAEELGLIFSAVALLLFILFFVFAIYIAAHAMDRFGRLLVMGMAFIIFFQASFNIGVVCEALPTKGMALPFFSYGGTNLLSAFFAVGTILSVGIHSLRARHRVAHASVIMRQH
jgi:cell division protein FtsW